MEEDRREYGNDRGRREDEDVEEREWNMAQRHDHAEVVGEIEAGSRELAAGLPGPEGRQFVSRQGIGCEEDGDKETEKADDLGGGQARAADVLDDAVGEDPAGEAADGEEDGREIGGAGGRLGAEKFGLGIGGQGGWDRWLRVRSG